ncbi:copper transporter [Catenuloplanes sp. NPDC051500]|uniref:copper transporter n=1 Tax=Catenuloplanes sp. NPDC051500 TaxID=3363959 RepID=UPI0037B1D2A7
MINFRYHVVSLTAVFLALAIGLVVGTAALNGPVVDGLDSQVKNLSKDNSQLRESVGQLQDEVNSQEEFATAAAPMLLAGKLTGRRVALVVLPTAADYAEQLRTMLATAGATVTGRVDVRESFVDPANSVNLLDLAHRAAQTTLPASGLPSNANGVETSAALLATALLDRPAPAAVTDSDRNAVLAAYAAANYVTVEDDKVSGSAEAVVIVAGLPPTGEDSDKMNASAVTLVEQFDVAGPLVVGGNGVGDGNVVAAVLADAALSKTIATVDNVNTAQGAVVTCLALTESLAANKIGHYGLGAGATSMLPTPAQ